MHRVAIAAAKNRLRFRSIRPSWDDDLTPRQTKMSLKPAGLQWPSPIARRCVSKQHARATRLLPTVPGRSRCGPRVGVHPARRNSFARHPYDDYGSDIALTPGPPTSKLSRCPPTRSGQPILRRSDVMSLLLSLRRYVCVIGLAISAAAWAQDRGIEPSRLPGIVIDDTAARQEG